MKKIFLMFDYVLLLVIFSLVTLGVIFIYSSSVNIEGVSVTNEYIKQIIWFSMGFIVLIFTTIYDYRKLESKAVYLYIALILILIYTLIFGRYVNGARSWIGIGEFGIQPSEFGKIFFIIFLAKYLDESSLEQNQLKRFFISILILLLPLGLILLQPDLGTGSVYLPIFLFMCFIAGIPIHYLLYVFLIGCLTIIFGILPVWNAEIAKTPIAAITILTNNKLRYILIASTLLISLIGLIIKKYFHNKKYSFWITYIFSIFTFSLILSVLLNKFLKYYQIKRLIVFMDPNTDPLGSGWNIIQSKIAIGAGGMTGQGFLQGIQSHGRFLPQQSTDFIFSILSEEFGFIGGLIVFVLYLIIFIKTLLVVKNSSNKFGSYIAIGIFGMFVFHFFINVGMVMGIMPITGIPLLFLSYGGSSLLTAMTCMGLLMSIHYRRKDLY